MSLDITLLPPEDTWDTCPRCEGAGRIGTTEEYYTAGITHNLNRMAQEAGIYKHLWRPDEIGVTKAGELIEPLSVGLVLLRSDRSRFKEFNPSNGYGDYEHLVDFVERYLRACKRHPEARVEVSR